MPEHAAKLENSIGHKFADPKLLERSLTHRSWAYENLPAGDELAIREAENESMEFLGDSVLGLVIAEELFSKHPDKNEGDLTLMKHHLVSTATLASVAATLSLGNFVKFGRGEEKTGGRKKQALLANSLEAVIAAVFLDGGYSAARVFITRIFREELRRATPTNSVDYKTLFQELLQSQQGSAPSYKVVKTEGPPHDRTFTVEAVWGSRMTRGVGNSIKSAEMDAAEKAYKLLNDSAEQSVER
jgi:ribonuclease III